MSKKSVGKSLVAKNPLKGFNADTPPLARKVRNYSLLGFLIIGAVTTGLEKSGINLPSWLSTSLEFLKESLGYLGVGAQFFRKK